MNCLSILCGVVSAYLTFYILDDVAKSMEKTPALPFYTGVSRSVVSLPHRLSKDLVTSSVDVVLQGGTKVCLCVCVHGCVRAWVYACMGVCVHGCPV